MGKKTFVVLLILYVVLLVGCGGSNQKIDADYRTGTGTLQLSFDSKFPPQSMIEGEQNAIVVKAKNAGGYAIPFGKLLITTDDSVLFLGTKNAYLDGVRSFGQANLVKGRPLLGRSVITPSGAEEVFSFEIYALPLPQESAKRSTTITTYACFPYETFQTASVCIDFDPYQNIAPKGVKRVCELKDVSAATGGGPINVGTIQTRIEKSPEGDLLPSFYFNIAASSSFKFFALGSQDAFCDSRQIRAEVHDTVYFSAALSDQFLVCDGVDLVPGYQNTYSVTLVNNKAKIMCSSSNQLFTYGNEAPSNYLAPLTINMTYGVVSTASRTITINAMS